MNRQDVGDVMAKKKRRKLRVSGIIILAAMLAFSVFAITKIVNEVQTTIELNASLNSTKKEKEALEEQKKMLEQEKSNLNNEEYIVRYARHKYMHIKENGEQVFELPPEE